MMHPIRYELTATNNVTTEWKRQQATLKSLYFSSIQYVLQNIIVRFVMKYDIEEFARNILT